MIAATIQVKQALDLSKPTVASIEFAALCGAGIRSESEASITHQAIKRYLGAVFARIV